jgi:uncharacterized OB-fold protein
MTIAEENLQPSQTYADGLAEGKFLYQRCDACGRAVFYPRLACNHCGSTAVRFTESSGTGTVYSNTAVAQRDAPSYSVCLVDLDDGFRMMSSVVDVIAEDVAIGQRVRARVEPLADGSGHRVVFTPEETS